MTISYFYGADDSVVISPQFAEELLESVGSFKSRYEMIWKDLYVFEGRKLPM